MTSGGILCEYFVLWRYGLSRLNTHCKQGCNEHTATMDLKKVAGWKNTDLTMIIIIYIIASMIIDIMIIPMIISCLRKDWTLSLLVRVLGC